MAGRRRFGRVRKLPSGRWQARYRAPDGQDHRASETFTTKTAADRWLAALETDLMRGQWIDPRAGSVLLSTFPENWLAGGADLEVRTQELCRWLLGKYVVPQLGHLRLEELTPSTVRAWHATLLRDGSPSPTRQACALLRAMLNTAVSDELLLRNPCLVRGAGVARSGERTTATLAQVEALAEAVPPRYRLLILLAAWSGARWGELVALSLDRLDLERGTMRIDRQYVELEDNSLVLDTPKTAAGIRTVHIPPHLLPDLRAHLEDHRTTPRWCSPPGSAGR
jgi:integrase